jgi:hypothetical protein
MDLIKDKLKVRGYYQNKIDRISFSIQAVVCNEEYDDQCQSKESVRSLLSQIYFTSYILEENVEFG